MWLRRCSARLADSPHTVGATRRIVALALPALGVLAAEPLYLLFDTAVVGRLGALAHWAPVSESEPVPA